MAYKRKEEQGRGWVYNKAGDEFVIRLMNDIAKKVSPITFTEAISILSNELRKINNQVGQKRWPVSINTLRSLIDTNLKNYDDIPPIFIPKPYRKLNKGNEIKGNEKWYDWTISLRAREAKKHVCCKLTESISDQHITLKSIEGNYYSYLISECIKIDQIKSK